MNYNRVVHVGYPKAGSSFLQKHIFSQLRDYSVADYTEGKSFAVYVLNSGLFFNEEIAKSLINNNSRKFILSNELLIGNPIKGNGVNSELTPIKLKKSGFNKVIISTRKNKQKWVKSLYSEFLKLGGKLSYTDFIESPKRYDSEYTYYYPEMIDHYEAYVNYYRQIFGLENVLIFNIEEDLIDKALLESRINKFLQTDINLNNLTLEKTNASLSGWMQTILLLFNNILSSRISPSSYFRWFSTQRLLRVLQFFTSESLTKHK